MVLPPLPVRLHLVLLAVQARSRYTKSVRVSPVVRMGILTTLSHSSSINLDGYRDVPAVCKFGPGGKTNFTTPANGTGLDVDIVAVLEQDGVVASVGDIDGANLHTTRSRDTEDSATTTTSLDTVDLDISCVSAVELSSFVSKT